MATGRNPQLTQRQGEYLVAAELCRLGYLTTTFSGNVPELDIIAVNERLEARPVQVKTIKGASWQFDAKRFVNIEYNEKTKKQAVKGRAKIKYPELKFVLVDLSGPQGPEYYILGIKTLREIIYRGYVTNLEKHNWRRPKTPNSTHTALPKQLVKRYKDKWDSVFK
jgi:Holliday junction resolvase-like predicted endonuclease